MANFINNNNQSKSGYRDKLDKIKKAKKLFRDNEKLFTPFEAKSLREEINGNIQVHYAAIYQGMAGELETAITAYKAAQLKAQEAVTRERNSWDTRRLLDEMSLAQARLQNAIAAQKRGGIAGIGAIAAQGRAMYQETLQSGDKHKIRAMAEALQALDTQGLSQEDRWQFNNLTREAGEKLAALQYTDEMAAAAEIATGKASELMKLHREIVEVGETLGDATRGPFQAGGFSKLVKRVQVDPTTRRIEVYDVDDPAVSGVDWSNLEAMQDDSDFELTMGGNND